MLWYRWKLGAVLGCSILFSFQIPTLSTAQEKITGLVYYAIENLDTPQSVLRGFAGSAGVAFDNLILSPDTNYRFWLLEAGEFRIANIDFTTPSSGGNVAVPDFNFRQASSHDSDGDGLRDLAEFIAGTNGLDPDSDDDGILDSAEIRQGTDALEGTPARTGLLATTDTPGTAKDISAFNDVVAVADSDRGVSVFNVFNGMDPLRIAQVNTPGSADAVSIGGDFLAVADGASGLAVIGLSDPPTASIIRQIPFLSNVFCVAADGQIAYVGLTNGTVVMVDMGSGLEIDRISLTNGRIEDLRLYGGNLFAVREGTLYVLSFINGALVEIGSVASPGAKSTTSDTRMRLFVAGGLAYHVNITGYNVIDVSDPANPALLHSEVTGAFGWKNIVTNGNGLGIATTSPNSTFDGPHNVSIYDVSDPNNSPNFLTDFQTPGVARAVTIYNGIAYVADHTGGMSVVNYLPYDSAGVPPAITILEPQDGDSVEGGSVVRVQVNATDDVQVRNVEFYVDNQLLKTDGNYPFEVTLPVGLNIGDSSVLVARASDTGGNATFSDPVVLNITPDSTPPFIVSSRPRDGTLVGNISGVTIIFSEAIAPDTLTGDSFFITSAGADEILGNGDDAVVQGGEFAQNEDGNIVTLAFGDVLDEGTYQIRITTDVTDNIGNTLSETFTSVFSALSGSDRDGDGVPDGLEVILGLDFENPDTDGDGTPDGEEDNDGDNIGNALEVFLGFDPSLVDTDGDGINDDLEDQDSDGLPDFAEAQGGTNINNPDTDSDGYDDNLELLSGSNPLDGDSTPSKFVQTPVVVYQNLVEQGGLPQENFTASPVVIYQNLSNDPDDQKSPASQVIHYENTP